MRREAPNQRSGLYQQVFALSDRPVRAAFY
jgi:hypothetical protein